MRWSTPAAAVAVGAVLAGGLWSWGLRTEPTRDPTQILRDEPARPPADLRRRSDSLVRGDQLAGQWLLLAGRLERGAEDARPVVEQMRTLSGALREADGDPEVLEALRPQQDALVDQLLATDRWMAEDGVARAVERIVALLDGDLPDQ